jgi:hypothetical protein
MTSIETRVMLAMTGCPVCGHRSLAPRLFCDYGEGFPHFAVCPRCNARMEGRSDSGREMVLRDLARPQCGKEAPQPTMVGELPARRFDTAFACVGDSYMDHVGHGSGSGVPSTSPVSYF